jgi:hypothetical protein
VASAEVDLASAYDVGQPGAYHVAFVGRVLDVAREGEPLPRASESHRACEAPGEPVSFRIVAP